MRLVRDNDDPKVKHDLELLAGTFGRDADERETSVVGDDEQMAAPGAGVPTAAGADGLADAGGTNGGAEEDAAGRTGDPNDPLQQLDDPVVRSMVRTSVHVRRFFPYYLGAALWVLVMLLISPRTDAPSGPTEGGFAFAEDSSSVQAPEESVESAFTEEVAPSFADIGATPAESGFGFSSPASGGSDFAAGSDFSDSGSSPTSGGFDSSEFDSGSSGFSSDFSSGGTDVADDPEPLRITKSGYSSATGGTPLEQAPPENGLPVSKAGSEVVKRSFIGVSGDESILRLKLVDDPSNVGVEQAVVRACPIVVEDWKAERGQSFDDQPLFQDTCVDGVRGDDGIFSFDLSKLGTVSEFPGFALTPGAVAGAYSLTFDPQAVTSG